MAEGPNARVQTHLEIQALKRRIRTFYSLARSSALLIAPFGQELGPPAHARPRRDLFFSFPLWARAPRASSFSCVASSRYLLACRAVFAAL